MKIFFNAFLRLLILLLPAFATAQISEKKPLHEDYYTPADFSKVKKVDAHVHMAIQDIALMEQAIKDNFTLISVNTEIPDYPSIKDQEKYCLALMKKFPGNIYYLSTFETETINKPGWAGSQIAYLRKSLDSGAIGIKVWKNIGMVIKDKSGKFIMIDDPVFDPVFDYLENNKIPVLGHIGEPRSCWMPIDQMVSDNDKSYYSKFPEYHMYLHPDNASYDELITARDHLLEKHPGLVFTGAHLGSMEWSVDEISARLARFPNMAVDLTDRVYYLQIQSRTDWQKVHSFFVIYQDRIIYGTDLESSDKPDSQKIKQEAHETWIKDWEYFTTDNMMNDYKVGGSFKGLKLPKKIIDKIYYHNALRWYPGIKRHSQIK